MQAGALWIFLISCGFVLYALAGYPLLVRLLARRFPKPVRKGHQRHTVTVLLPVHNGEQWIRQKLESILALDYPRELVNVLVLSDGSTDGTAEIAAAFASQGVEVIKLPKGGKAVALNKGLELAQGEIVFFTDVRQRLDRQCLQKLVNCFADPGVGGVCGEMIILEGETEEEASVGLYWTIEKWIRRQLSAMGTLLVVTGCLYAIRRKLARPLPAGALGDDIFMPQAVLRQGYRVIFEPEAKAYDYPTDASIEFPRKVRTLAALYQYVGRQGFGPRPFHFFSYKIARLLLPYALIAIAISSLFLPTPLLEVAITGQVLFYGLAWADRFVPERTLVKRISSAARTFCMLMYASLCAVSIFFRPSKNLWAVTQVRTPKNSSG